MSSLAYVDLLGLVLTLMVAGVLAVWWLGRHGFGDTQPRDEPTLDLGDRSTGDAPTGRRYVGRHWRGTVYRSDHAYNAGHWGQP